MTVEATGAGEEQRERPGRVCRLVGWVRPSSGTASLRPKTLAGGRGRVYGCLPGCLLLSLAVSVILIIVANVLIWLL